MPPAKGPFGECKREKIHIRVLDSHLQNSGRGRHYFAENEKLQKKIPQNIMDFL